MGIEIKTRIYKVLLTTDDGKTDEIDVYTYGNHIYDVVGFIMAGKERQFGHENYFQHCDTYYLLGHISRIQVLGWQDQGDNFYRIAGAGHEKGDITKVKLSERIQQN